MEYEDEEDDSDVSWVDATQGEPLTFKLCITDKDRSFICIPFLYEHIATLTTLCDQTWVYWSGTLSDGGEWSPVRVVDGAGSPQVVFIHLQGFRLPPSSQQQRPSGQ